MSNHNSANHTKNVMTYMRKQRQFLILLNPEKDADCISWLESQKNKNKSIRKLIRQSIKKNRMTANSTSKLRAKRRSQGVCIYCGLPDARTAEGKAVCQTCMDKATARRHNK